MSRIRFTVPPASTAAVIAWACVRLAVTSAFAAPVPTAGYSLIVLSNALPSASVSGISQMAFMPGDPDHLYAARGAAGEVTRYTLDPATGLITAAVAIATGLPNPVGIAFRDSALFVSLNLPGEGRLARLRDLNHDGLYEERVDFVRGIPLGLHGVNQVQIRGATLFTGIGTQTNGGNPTYERIYNGVLARIGDLDQVVYDGVANALADSVSWLDSATLDGRLRRYAYGLRNPFGVRVTAGGAVWASDNGASACSTDCSLKHRFPIDTPDLIYAAVPQGARGQFPPAGYPGGGGATMSPLATLANHSAVTGFDWIASGSDAGALAVAEFGASNAALDAGRDLLRVNATTGAWQRVVTGFGGPTDVLCDAAGRLLISDYASNVIYALLPPGTVGVVPGRPRGDIGIRIARVSPQPATRELEVEIELANRGSVALDVFAVNGARIGHADLGTRAAGSHRIRWSASATRITSGVVFLRASAGSSHAEARAVLVR